MEALATRATRSTVQIRVIQPTDIPRVLQILQEHADFHNESAAMTATNEDLHAAFFSSDPRVFCDVAEMSGEIIGLMVWYFTYSTFLGRPGIHIEDVYIVPSSRRAGVTARAFLRELTRKCDVFQIGRVEWVSAEWNQVLTNWAAAIGASGMEGWRHWRSSGEVLRRRYSPERAR